MNPPTVCLTEVAVFPRKGGTVVYPVKDAQKASPFLTTRIPKGGKGDDSWYCCVTIQSTSGVQCDILCAQFDVCGPHGQPHLILPAAEYLVCVATKRSGILKSINK